MKYTSTSRIVNLVINALVFLGFGEQEAGAAGEEHRDKGDDAVGGELAHDTAIVAGLAHRDEEGRERIEKEGEGDNRGRTGDDALNDVRIFVFEQFSHRDVAADQSADHEDQEHDDPEAQLTSANRTIIQSCIEEEPESSDIAHGDINQEDPANIIVVVSFKSFDAEQGAQAAKDHHGQA